MDKAQDIVQQFRLLRQQLTEIDLSVSQYTDVSEILFEIFKYIIHSKPPSQASNISSSDIPEYSKSLHPYDEWITLSRAETITGRNKGTFSRAVTEKKIASNGRRGRHRRVLKSEVLLFHHKLKENKENKDNSKSYYLTNSEENRH